MTIVTVKDPPIPEFVALNHSKYNGRDFYGSHAVELAEVNYLRDVLQQVRRYLETGEIMEARRLVLAAIRQ